MSVSYVPSTDDEYSPERDRRGGVKSRSSHGGPVVASFAYRSTQVEVTPVNSDVLTQTSVRQLQIHFDSQHNMWYLSSGNKTSPNSSRIPRGGGATTTTTTAGLDKDAPSTSLIENQTHCAEGGLAQAVATTCASGGRPRNGEKERGRASKNVSREEVEGKEAAGTPVEVPHEKMSAGHDVDQATEKELPAAEATKENRTLVRKTPEPRTQEGREIGVATEQTAASADGPDGSFSASPNDVAKEPSVAQRAEASATAVGGSSGRGDRESGRCQVEESAAAPGSSNNSENTVKLSKNQVEPDTPAPSNPEGSTDCAGYAGSGPIQMTWRGQPATLVEPIVITLKDSSVRLHASGAKALAGKLRGGVSSSSDEGFSASPPEVRRRAKMNASARRGGSSVERDGDERRAPNNGDGSKHGSSAEGENLSTSRCVDVEEDKAFGGRPEETEAKGAGGRSGTFDHADGKSSSRRGLAARRRREEEALPWDRVGSPGPTIPRSSPSKTAFLREPYLGPPVAAGCFPAWPPSGTGVMADPKAGGRQRRGQRAPRRRSSKSHASRRARGRCTGAAGAKNGSSSSSSTAGGTTSSGGSRSRSSGEAFGGEEKNIT